MHSSNQSIYCYNTFFDLYSRFEHIKNTIYYYYFCYSFSIENGTKEEIKFT